MTARFPTRLIDLLEHREPTPPAIVSSTPKPWETAAAEHAALRSRAEHLVCQANVALRVNNKEIVIEDHRAENLIGFTLRFVGRAMRICVRRCADDCAVARFDGWGSRCSEPVQLAGPEALEDAILLLVTGATRTRPSNPGYLV